MSADSPASGQRRAAKAFDVRTIIALLFVIYGVVLTAMGLFHSPEQTDQGGSANLNLWSGLGMLIFSLLMGGWVLLKPLSVPEQSETNEESGPATES